MKKLHLILAGFLLIANAQAQRAIDLEVSLLSPVANTTITASTPFNVSAVIKNVDTTTFRATDTVVYFFMVDTTVLQFSNGTQTFSAFVKSGVELNQNDTMMINVNLSINYPTTLAGSRSFCMAGFVVNRSADSVSEVSMLNNVSCASVTLADITTDVRELTAALNNHAVVNVFPVPANDRINFDLSLSENADVTLKIIDLTGRTVAEAQRGKMGKGRHTVTVHTADLATGVYIYQVRMNDEVTSGKLSVRR